MRVPKLSDRTVFTLHDNVLARAIAEARAARRPLVDLTESNPTHAGLAPGAEMLGELGHPRAAVYEPSALGHEEARAAVAAYYESKGVTVDPAHVVLSASTSEAYAWMFKLLCDRDDAVLVPRPSYPLFEYLAALEDVRLVPYPLIREEGFRVDVAAVERAIADEPRARAILLVHPNNPTGSFVRRDDAEALERLAAAHGLALVSDEVFGDYALPDASPARLPTFAGRDTALTFVLSGLSKVVALPQVKLGWTIASGPKAALDAALSRLEIIADTYLSVGTPIQRALPAILGGRSAVQTTIRERTLDNLRALDAALARQSIVRRLPVEGGWSVILEVPRTMDEEAWAELLVREEGLVVHPGFFFDLDREGYLVISLLPRADAFVPAIERLIARLAAG